MSICSLLTASMRHAQSMQSSGSTCLASVPTAGANFAGSGIKRLSRLLFSNRHVGQTKLPAGWSVCFSRTRKAKKKKKPLGMAGKQREGKRNSGHCWASLRVSWLASRRPDGETTRCQLTKPRLIRRTISIGQTRLRLRVRKQRRRRSHHLITTALLV